MRGVAHFGGGNASSRCFRPSPVVRGVIGSKGVEGKVSLRKVQEGAGYRWVGAK